MTSLLSIEHLNKICRSEEERISSFVSFLDYLESVACCNDALNSIRVLQNIVPDLQKTLENQSRRVEVLELAEKTTFKFEDVYSYIHTDEYLRSVLRVSSFIFNHITAGKNKKFGKECHAIQMLMHECGKNLNYILNKPRPIYAIGFLGGRVPSHIPSITDITPISMPVIDFLSSKAWPIIGHEMAHGYLKHRKGRTIEKSYQNEFIADLFSTVIFGPSYFLSFFSNYGGVPSVTRQIFRETEGLSPEKTHPSLENRFVFCIDVLEKYLRYDDEIIKNLRKNLTPLFHYAGAPDSDDAKQKSVAMKVLEGFSVKKDLQSRIKSNGYQINERKSKETLKKLDSGEKLVKEPPRDMLNALFLGCYLEETFNPDEKNIDRCIIDSLYENAKSDINCC